MVSPLMIIEIKQVRLRMLPCILIKLQWIQQFIFIIGYKVFVLLCVDFHVSRECYSHGRNCYLDF